MTRPLAPAETRLRADLAQAIAERDAARNARDTWKRKANVARVDALEVRQLEARAHEDAAATRAELRAATLERDELTRERGAAIAAHTETARLRVQDLALIDRQARLITEHGRTIADLRQTVDTLRSEASAARDREKALRDEAAQLGLFADQASRANLQLTDVLHIVVARKS